VERSRPRWGPGGEFQNGRGQWRFDFSPVTRVARESNTGIFWLTRKGRPDRFRGNGRDEGTGVSRRTYPHLTVWAKLCRPFRAETARRRAPPREDTGIDCRTDPHRFRVRVSISFMAGSESSDPATRNPAAWDKLCRSYRASEVDRAVRPIWHGAEFTAASEGRQSGVEPPHSIERRGGPLRGGSD
jgi:hypothetical protein